MSAGPTDKNRRAARRGCTLAPRPSSGPSVVALGFTSRSWWLAARPLLTNRRPTFYGGLTGCW
jgi:hypothetical protein